VITAAEENFVVNRAYVPEHIPAYVVAISRAEPHLIGDYLCYQGEGSLVFIGYPLNSAFDEKAMVEALAAAISRFSPDSVALTAPAISIPQKECRARDSDCYYRLELPALRPDKKVENMVRRASRELSVEISREIGEEHIRLIAEFLDSRRVDEGTAYIFERIPAYVSAVPTARVFDARDKHGNLAAFDVADFGARDYAFYQFNFVSKTRSAPGASDLLLHEVIRTVRMEGKPFLNLGLGIHEGIAHFKKKWGGIPFLKYEFCRYRPRPSKALAFLLGKL
jgi:hypothetical protein